jgi:hypothetical protein
MKQNVVPLAPPALDVHSALERVRAQGYDLAAWRLTRRLVQQRNQFQEEVGRHTADGLVFRRLGMTERAVEAENAAKKALLAVDGIDALVADQGPEVQAWYPVLRAQADAELSRVVSDAAEATPRG